MRRGFYFLSTSLVGRFKQDCGELLAKAVNIYTTRITLLSTKRNQSGELESGEQEGERKTGRKQNQSQPSLSSTCFSGACSLT